MKKWNIGVVGAGLIADFHAKAIRDLPDSEIAGFCDNGSGRAKSLAEKYGCQAYRNYESLIEDPDVNLIMIASPSGNHLGYRASSRPRRR